MYTFNKLIGIILLLIITSDSNLLPQTTDSSSSQIIKLDDSNYKLGNLMLNKDAREIIIPGKVNMDTGFVEVFACSRGGKEHESILVLELSPYHLQVALLLLGLNPVDPEVFSNTSDLQKFSVLNIWVNWETDGEKKLHRAEDLIWDVQKNGTMEETRWIFRGSLFINGTFAADDIKSLITTYNDPTAIIDNPLVSGQNDEIYQVNSNIVPPKGTGIEVIIKLE